MKKVITFKNIFIVTILILTNTLVNAQVKIGDNPTTINANSVLEIESTNKGLLMPRVPLTATTNASPLLAHIAGMTVYNTATAGDVTPGYYYNDGTKWVRLAAATQLNNYWSITGNAGTTAGTNFLGTTDDVNLVFKRNNLLAGYLGTVASQNTSFGVQSLPLSTGTYNAAFGFQAMNANSTGQFNAAFGDETLKANTSGNANSAFGHWALRANTTGYNNTALGHTALYSNIQLL